MFASKSGRKLFFQQIFITINTLQLLVYHPLIDLNFPSNLIAVNEQFADIATYDLYPTDNLFPKIFGFDIEKFSPLNDRFYYFRYQT